MPTSVRTDSHTNPNSERALQGYFHVTIKLSIITLPEWLTGYALSRLMIITIIVVYIYERFVADVF